MSTLTARVEEHLKRMGAVMEVRPGDKRTEVGFIPTTWKTIRLGELSEFITSGSGVGRPTILTAARCSFVVRISEAAGSILMTVSS